MNSVAHNIYIHVPFCASKCRYCAFFSNTCAAPDWGAYSDSVCSELDYWSKRLGKVSVPTIFFGGGTPSLMPVAVFEKIMCRLSSCFALESNCEITLESNPGTLDIGRLKDFCLAGMNRLSVGVQRLDDVSLAFLGRRHSVRDARVLIDGALSCGVRTSADFIYGLPGDDVDVVKGICNQINKIGLTHCSMYELTIEPGTPLARMSLDMPDNALMADMYMSIASSLSLPRYEVSNYSVPGQECRHNQNVWGGDAYIGIGRGGAGRVYLDGVWYDQMGAFQRFDSIDVVARSTEMLITGLRTVRGCLLTDDVKRVIDMDWVYSHPDLICMSGDCIFATVQGMMVLDDVILNVVR